MPRLALAMLVAVAICLGDGRQLGSPSERDVQTPPISPVKASESARPVRHVSTRTYVTSRARNEGWTGGEWECLNSLLWAESSWDPDSDNPTSTAYGLFQLLRTPPGLPLDRQVDRGFRYIRHRYGTPCEAWAFHRRHNYY